MAAVVAFLRPTKLKLAFLVQWVLFILITAAQGKLNTNRQILIAVYPLIIFYLAACAFTALSQHTPQLAQGWKLLALALGLTILDQASKIIVIASIPYQTSIPIIDGWLRLAHERNYQGSWVASTFNLPSVGVLNVLQWLLAVSFPFGSILCHRYYTTTNRESLWADVVFLGLFAGYASWICDMAVRGYITDFINLPGLVTADLKDILVAFGAAAVFAEVLDNPELSWRWQGWRQEGEDLIQLTANLLSFSIQELRKGLQAAASRFRRDIKSWQKDSE